MAAFSGLTGATRAPFEHDHALQARMPAHGRQRRWAFLAARNGSRPMDPPLSRCRPSGSPTHAIVPGVTSLEAIRQRAAQIRAIASEHGARNVRVVGSVARGTDREDSDLDLVVTFDPGVGLLSHAKLILELEQLLGRRVDVASERGLRPEVRQKLEADAKPL